VLQGETLDAIAHRYATPASSISAVNQKVHSPEAGDLLVIPAGYPQRAAVHSSTSTARHRAAHHTIASRTASRAASGAASRTSTAGAYKTAALAVKHRPAAN
jgi:hypothetical protein